MMNSYRIPASEVKVGDMIVTGKATAYPVYMTIPLSECRPARVMLAHRTAKRENLITFDSDDMIEIKG